MAVVVYPRIEGYSGREIEVLQRLRYGIYHISVAQQLYVSLISVVEGIRIERNADAVGDGRAAKETRIALSKSTTGGSERGAASWVILDNEY